jgi:hypothetical protein
MKAHVGVALTDAVKEQLPIVVRAELGKLGLSELSDQLSEIVALTRGRSEKEQLEFDALKIRERQLEIEKKALELEIARGEAHVKQHKSLAEINTESTVKTTDAEVKKLDAGTRNLRVRTVIYGGLFTLIATVATAAITSQCNAPKPYAAPPPPAYMPPEHDAGH